MKTIIAAIMETVVFRFDYVLFEICMCTKYYRHLHAVTSAQDSDF